MQRSAREQEALDATAAIAIEPRVGLALVVASALLLVLPPLLHLVLAPGALGRPVTELATEAARFSPTAPIASNVGVMKKMEELEDAVRNTSPLAQHVRPVVQRGLFIFGAGNAQVRVVDDTLVFQPSLVHLLTDRFVAHAPLEAVATFDEDLRRKGIRLLLVPTPAKPTVDGGLWGMPDLVHPQWPAFGRHLDLYDIPYVDVAGVLAERDGPHYLRQDTHWRPEAMEAVAERIAKRLAGMGMPRRAARRDRPVVPRNGTGDLVDLLGLPPGVVEPERVEVRPGERLPGSARVLLLGDSFSNIFHDDSLGFGAGAGLPEALEAELGHAVRTLLINDEGAVATRRALAADPALLDGIEVVVWQFAERELSLGDWEVVRLGGETLAATDDALRLDPGSSRKITGFVTAVAPRGSPSSAVYDDSIVALRIALQPGQADGVEHAWAFTWDLQERVPAPIPPRDVELSLQLVPLSDAPAVARRAARSTLEKPPGEAVLWLAGWEAR